MKKKLSKLNLSKETLLSLSKDETGQAAGGLSTAACTVVCGSNTGRPGECCQAAT